MNESSLFDKSGMHISMIDNPTVEEQMCAVGNHPINIIYIKDPCEEAQIQAVSTHSRAINNIRLPTQKTLNVFFNKILTDIICTAPPDENMLRERLLQEPHLLCYITEPSEELQLEILEHNWNEWTYEIIIDLPCKKSDNFMREFNRLKLHKGSIVE